MGKSEFGAFELSGKFRLNPVRCIFYPLSTVPGWGLLRERNALQASAA